MDLVVRCFFFLFRNRNKTADCASRAGELKGRRCMVWYGTELRERMETGDDQKIKIKISI